MTADPSAAQDTIPTCHLLIALACPSSVHPTDHTGPCRWFMSDGVTADPSAAQDTIPTCRQCQADCLEAPNCIFWSFNSSDTMAYNETSDCGVNVTGGLLWWGQGSGS